MSDCEAWIVAVSILRAKSNRLADRCASKSVVPVDDVGYVNCRKGKSVNTVVYYYSSV